MRDALVFNTTSFLNFHNVRANVIRIPEVILRLRQAQIIWDDVSSESLDLANFLASDDEVFLSNIRRKQFVSAVVQVGLLDRYLRQHKAPEFFVGRVNGDSALNVAAGLKDFVEMVSESPAVTLKPVTPQLKLVSSDLPVLTGIEIEEYGVYQRTAEGTYERKATERHDGERLVLDLIENEDLKKLVVVGPGMATWAQKAFELVTEVQVLESIELDPMLSWFWSRTKTSHLAAVAN